MHLGIALGHAVPGGINLPEPSNLSVHELTTLDVAHNSDGRLEVFGVDPLGHIWHTWQTAPGADWSGSWSELDGDGENLSSLRVVQNADGRLEVFAVTTRGNVWHTWQTTAGGAWAGTWAQLYTDGETLAAIDAARNGDGRLEVFGIDPAGQVWHTWQTYAGGDWSGTWHLLHTDEGRLSSLRVGQNADGRLEVFGIDRRANIWHTWQRSNGGAWTDGWTPLYTDRDELAMLDVGLNSDGRLEVFGIDPTGHIWHTAQTSAGGAWIGRWNGVSADGDALASLRIAQNADGRLEVFGASPDGHVWHTWQTAAGGPWSGGWAGLDIGADPVGALVPARNRDGRLEVFALDYQGRPVRASQTAPGDRWTTVNGAAVADRANTDTPPVPPIAGAEATDALPIAGKVEAMTDEPEVAVAGAEANGAGDVAPPTPAPASAAPVSPAPPKQAATQTDQPAAPSDGIAGTSALRGLIVYGAVLAFAALYIDFAVVISRAAHAAPTIDATLVDAAAALAGILGSAFAIRIGNPANQAVINQSLATHLTKAQSEDAKKRTKLLAYLHRAVSLEVGKRGATSWPITFGLWVYAAVGSMLVVVYVLNESQTPGTVKALAVTFAGYVLALLTSAFKSAGNAGSSS